MSPWSWGGQGPRHLGRDDLRQTYGRPGASGVEFGKDMAHDRAQGGKVRCQTLAEAEARALEEGELFHRYDTGGVGPVFEHPVAPEEFSEGSRQIPRHAGRQHEMLVPLHDRDGVDLDALKVADLAQNRGGSRGARRIVRRTAEQMLRLQQESDGALSTDSQRGPAHRCSLSTDVMGYHS
jgi:hypothetical protein